MNNKILRELYNKRYNNYLTEVAPILEMHIKERISSYPRIDKISVRPKSIERFLSKSQKLDENNNLKYNDPINQIQDQIGARIVTYYLDDILEVSKIIEQYFRHIEKHMIIPDSVKEFGYEGLHYILFIPDEIIQSKILKNNIPKFFELQIKTLFQNAWSEAEHDLGYKPTHKLSQDEIRKISFTAAQAWGADWIFNELNQKQKNNNFI